MLITRSKLQGNSEDTGCFDFTEDTSPETIRHIKDLLSFE